MKSIFIFLIKVYQKAISPIFYFLGVRCRFVPTCSEYSILAIKKYGIIKGVFYSVKRILKCNPFGPHGYDPIENIEENKKKK